MTEVEEAVSKTVMQLMRNKNQTYIVSVLLQLQRVLTKDVPTAGVNGTTMVINPDFFMGLSEPERRYLVVHEAWHIGLMDFNRLGDKDPETWNMACDHYINLMIDEDNSLSFIKGGCRDHKYTGWEKDDIYKDLLSEGSSDTSPLAGDLQADGSSEEVAQAIQSIVQQAEMQARMVGAEVPEEISDFLGKLYNPQLPWENILMNYMDGVSNEDYSYRRFNKMMFPHNIILPTLYSEGLGRIAIANDTSGSVTDKEYATYLGAIKDIQTRLNPESIDVVAFTTRIESQWTIEKDEDIDRIQFRGYGGTDLTPVFQHFNKESNRPQVLIVFSDLECNPITQRPPYDVIWICVNNPDAVTHFGRRIDIGV